jgi:hypothetical protein
MHGMQDGQPAAANWLQLAENQSCDTEHTHTGCQSALATEVMKGGSLETNHRTGAMPQRPSQRTPNCCLSTHTTVESLRTHTNDTHTTLSQPGSSQGGQKGSAAASLFLHRETCTTDKGRAVSNAGVCATTTPGNTDAHTDAPTQIPWSSTPLPKARSRVAAQGSKQIFEALGRATTVPVSKVLQCSGCRAR